RGSPAKASERPRKHRPVVGRTSSREDASTWTSRLGRVLPWMQHRAGSESCTYARTRAGQTGRDACPESKKNGETSPPERRGGPILCVTRNFSRRDSEMARRLVVTLVTILTLLALGTVGALGAPDREVHPSGQVRYHAARGQA